MLVTKPYNRERAYEYAQRWALERNPLFLNFAGIGGDCTNFVSQCVYAGGCVMNYTPVFGWYYISSEDRTASWTGVEFFFNFITQNEGAGPFATETGSDGLSLGDVIQLGQEDGDFYHSLIVTGFSGGQYLVSAHSQDSLNRPLDTYTYARARFIHIEGVRMEIPDMPKCFDALIDGIMI